MYVFTIKLQTGAEYSNHHYKSYLKNHILRSCIINCIILSDTAKNKCCPRTDASNLCTGENSGAKH